MKLPVIILALFLAGFSSLIYAASCTGVAVSHCKMSNQVTTYTPRENLSNALADGTVIGDSTLSFDYVCYVPSSSDRYLILGIATETSSLGAGSKQYKTTTAGVILQTDGRGQVGGVYDRIDLGVIGPRTNGGNICVSGSKNVRIGSYVKSGTVTATNGLARLDFSPSANYVSALYNTGPPTTIMDVYSAPTPIPIGTATCILDGNIKNVDLGVLTSNQFSGVAYGAVPKNYSPVNFSLSFTCEDERGFTADISLDGISDGQNGYATDNENIAVIIQAADGSLYSPGAKVGSVNINTSGHSSSPLQLKAYPTILNGTAPSAGLFTSSVNIYITYQ